MSSEQVKSAHAALTGFRLVAFLGQSSRVTKCSKCDIALRRFLRRAYLENGRDECIILLSLHTQCMSVSVPGTCQRTVARPFTS